MKERPILFSAPMVRAILSGRKTQTRRAIKPAPMMVTDRRITPWEGPADALLKLLAESGRDSPYGQPGDRLWVRENGWERPERTARMMRDGADTWAPYYFDADGITEQEAEDFKAWGFKRRPSIHMPRWASRILLEIVSVRVERLQDISEADAIAEGCYTDPACPAYDAYGSLWEQINGPNSWAANPWVWVIEFKRVSA